MSEYIRFNDKMEPSVVPQAADVVTLLRENIGGPDNNV